MRTEPSISSEPESDLYNEAFAEEPESQLLSDYRQRYGLSVDPFADDPHFPLYTGAQRRQILDQILHLCQFSNNLLVVLGEYGVGKTRMAQALIDSLDDADDICFLEGQINSTIDSLLADIVEQFELPNAYSFTEFGQRQSGEDGLAVLIVDNAHHLTDEVIAELIRLVQIDDTRTHLVMFGEPHLIGRLERIDASDVVLSDFYLEKFSLTEAVDYLNFRMEMADYLGPEIFTETKVDSWWRQSQGQLLALHEFAQEKLLASVSQSQPLNKRALPVPHIVGASVLGAALLMGYFYWEKEPSTSINELPVSTQTVPVQKNTELPKPASSEAQASSAAVVETTSSSSPTSTPVVVQESSHTASVASVASVASSAAVQEKMPEPSVVKQSMVPLAQTNTMSSDVSRPAKANATASVKDVKKSDIQTESVKSSAKAESQNLDKLKSAASSRSFSDQEKEILSWNESEFTLQLVGLSSEKSVRDFLAEQPNKKDLLVFKSLRQGKDWFVVVTGRYPSSAKARQAIQLLPEQQKKASPWPRDIKTIQKEIKQK